MKKTGKSYSLRRIIITFVIIFVCIPLTTSVICFSQGIIKELKSSFKKSAAYYTSVFSNTLNAAFQNIDNTILYLLTSPTFIEGMESSQRLSSESMNETEQLLNHQIYYGDAWKSKFVQSFFVFKSADDYASATRNSYYKSAIQRNTDIYNRYKDSSYNSVFIEPNANGYLYYVRNYTSIHTQKNIGKIIVEFDLSAILETDYLKDLYPAANVILCDSSGKIYYSNSHKFDQSILKNQILPQLNGKTNTDIQLNGSTYLAVASKVPNYDISILILNDSRDVFQSFHQSELAFYFITLVVMLVTLLFAYLLAYKFTAPLENAVAHMVKFGKGDLSVRMPKYRYQELNVLSMTFNEMSETIEKLINEVYRAQLLSKDAELKNLEAQINPHFIFNLLNMIYWKSIKQNAPEITELVSKLAELIRGTINVRGKQKIQLEQELTYVKIYLELQKQRFGNRLNYRINVEDDSLYRYFIPKLLIQPVVENAVVHGLEEKREGGTVVLSVWEEDDGLYIKVTDDGVGFNPADPPKQTDGTNNHVALDNVRKRIRLLYKDPYGMKIESQIGKGTSITFHLPLDTKEECDNVSNPDR